MGRSTDFDAIVRLSGQPRERVKFALDELEQEAARRASSGENYILYAPALDMLALKHYADLDYAISLGKLIAKGKESDVYEVLSATSELYALKLFRLGRTSFRDVRRKRAHNRSETEHVAHEQLQRSEARVRSAREAARRSPRTCPRPSIGTGTRSSCRSSRESGSRTGPSWKTPLGC